MDFVGRLMFYALDQALGVYQWLRDVRNAIETANTSGDEIRLTRAACEGVKE